RYLLSVPTPGWERSKKGLLDAGWCDERALLSLVDHVGLLENLCTADVGSVVDYDEQGAPILASDTIQRRQRQRVAPVQDASAAFAADAERFFAAAGRPPEPVALRRAALGQLGRMFYFPSRQELDSTEDFLLDLNMATDDKSRLFDREQGLTGLR